MLPPFSPCIAACGGKISNELTRAGYILPCQAFTLCSSCACHMKLFLWGATPAISTFARIGKLHKHANSCSCHREILRTEQTFPSIYLHVFHRALEDLVITWSVLSSTVFAKAHTHTVNQYPQVAVSGHWPKWHLWKQYVSVTMGPNHTRSCIAKQSDQNWHSAPCFPTGCNKTTILKLFEIY